MDKFFSNLAGNKEDKNAKKDEKSWQGGRSDMDSIKNKSFVKKGSSENNNSAPKNIFANANSAIQKQMEQFKNKPSAKGGQSLGGSKPGRLISISLSQPGSLGLEVEKRQDSSQSAIVASVVPGSQAEKAGLKRGDIVCHANSDREFSYNEFLKVAKSGARPLQFSVRRMESTLVQGDGKGSADAMHRKQAMIAAAEAREAKHKALVKPVPKSTDVKLRADQHSKPAEYTESNSEETHRAVEAVKAAERSDAENLGYNPYEARAMTSGQARTATVAMTRGDINAENAPSKLKGEGGGETTAAPGRVSAPADPTISIPQEFDYAFSTLVTSSSDASATKKSLSTMRKLITNAITKGQQGDDATSSKFRRVRLSNPKIKEAITDMQGALELMMAVGFVLSENEEDGETYLVFPPETGAEWLGAAVGRMEDYERGG